MERERVMDTEKKEKRKKGKKKMERERVAGSPFQAHYLHRKIEGQCVVTE